MKQLFIEAKAKLDKVNLDKKDINKLPKKIGLVSTVQFVDYVKDIKRILEKNKKKCFVGNGKQKYKVQILGCDYSAAEKIKNKVDAFLYIGSGEFHPIGIALNTDKKVFCFNPSFNTFSEIKDEDIQTIKKKRKANLIKFYSSKSIGILVSTKPGQQNLKQALALKNKLKDKECYIFMFGTLDENQLENFPFVECWVNTACPRIGSYLAIDDINSY